MPCLSSRAPRRRGRGPRSVYAAPNMEGGNSKFGRSTRVAGRPPFGLGPIARVSTVATRPDDDLGGLDRFGFPSTPRSGVATAQRGYPTRPDPARTRAFGLPNLRRNVCPHFYVTGARGALPIHAPHLLKGLVRQDSAVSRCQLRGGVHLEQSYVNDVCLSQRFNQCVFYEEDLSQR
jgi:hypothetical protein